MSLFSKHRWQAQSLLKAADKATFIVKETGKHGFRFYGDVGNKEQVDVPASNSFVPPLSLKAKVTPSLKKALSNNDVPGRIRPLGQRLSLAFRISQNLAGWCSGSIIKSNNMKQKKSMIAQGNLFMK